MTELRQARDTAFTVLTGAMARGTPLPASDVARLLDAVRVEAAALPAAATEALRDRLHQRRGHSWPAAQCGSCFDLAYTAAQVYAEAAASAEPQGSATALPTAPAVDRLAQIIRKEDGDHSLGAGALAERIVASLPAVVVEPEGSTHAPAGQTSEPSTAEQVAYEMSVFLHGAKMAPPVAPGWLAQIEQWRARLSAALPATPDVVEALAQALKKGDIGCDDHGDRDEGGHHLASAHREDAQFIADELADRGYGIAALAAAPAGLDVERLRQALIRAGWPAEGSTATAAGIAAAYAEGKQDHD